MCGCHVDSTPEVSPAAGCDSAGAGRAGRFIWSDALWYSLSAEATLATHCARYSCRNGSQLVVSGQIFWEGTSSNKS